MALKRITISAIVVAALAAGAAAFALVSASRTDDGAGIGSIEDSYAFDVKDKTQLMSYGDEVIVGEVLEPMRTDEERSSTLWRVRIIRSIKGDRSGEAQVWQLGYVDSDGRAHVADEQPLLEPGRRYLLVTTREGDENTLVAGPAASVRVESIAQENRVVDEYRAARQ